MLLKVFKLVQVFMTTCTGKKKGLFITVILKSRLSFEWWVRRAWYTRTVCTCAETNRYPGNVESFVKYHARCITDDYFNLTVIYNAYGVCLHGTAHVH